jgi:hypothetical protein
VHDPNEAPKKPASHRTAVFILIAMTVGIAWFGWQTWRTASLSITTVSKPGEYPLPPPRKPAAAYWVHVTGWIDGQATIELPSNAPATIGPGNVEQRLTGALHDPQCILKYTPRGTSMGRLLVEYRFD